MFSIGDRRLPNSSVLGLGADAEDNAGSFLGCDVNFLVFFGGGFGPARMAIMISYCLIRSRAPWTGNREGFTGNPGGAGGAVGCV